VLYPIRRGVAAGRMCYNGAQEVSMSGQDERVNIRLPSRLRQKLEEIVAAHERHRPGYRLSDAAREALAVGIERMMAAEGRDERLGG
jgi:hypothetical protein